MSENTATTTIWQRLHAAMADIAYLEKGGYNAFHDYAYASDEDVMAAVHRAFVEHGLLFVPAMVEADQSENKTVARFEFEIVNVDTGESFAKPWVGEANDAQDKGINKAAVAAVKYFLLKTLLIPTGEASDPDSGGEDTRAGHRARATARNDGAPGDMVVNFAPKDHPDLKGKTIAELWTLDPGWVDWLGRNSRNTQVRVAAAAYAVMQAENPPAKAQEKAPTFNDPPNLELPANWTELWKRVTVDLRFPTKDAARKAYEAIFPEATAKNPPALSDAWSMLLQHQQAAGLLPHGGDDDVVQEDENDLPF